MFSDVLIIGGGAAGICAAIAARKKARENGIDDKGFSIIVLERNPRPGAKIRISGGGKCNVTHRGTVEELIVKGFHRETEQRFLRYSFYSFSNQDVRDLLGRHDVRTVARVDGKVFPATGIAGDVIRAFEEELKKSAVEVFTGERAVSAEKKSGVFRVLTEKTVFRAERLILATGGVSYPQTGTTGDGLKIASGFGHTIKKPLAALAPIYLKPAPFSMLAGVSLRGVGLTVRAEKKRVSRIGELLITHKGISGPACLSLSREAAELFEAADKVEVMIDFLPDISSEALKKLFLELVSNQGGQTVRKFLRMQDSIPSAFIPFIMQQAGVDPEEKWGNLTKKARLSLEHTLQNYVFGVVKAIPLDAGEVSAGGVMLKEVNRRTQESRRCENLFLCGELLDYTGEIGGFNLQAAFSTGWLAGSSLSISRYRNKPADLF